MANRDQAWDLVQEVILAGYSYEDIVNHLIGNHLSGTEAMYAMMSVVAEFQLGDEEDDDDLQNY